MQASLEETQAEQKQAARLADRTRQSSSDEAASSSTMGLRNATGEYNCFLNVIIQCLWHCRMFRQQVMAWQPQAYEASLVAAMQYKCICMNKSVQLIMTGVSVLLCKSCCCHGAPCVWHTPCSRTVQHALLLQLLIIVLFFLCPAGEQPGV